MDRDAFARAIIAMLPMLHRIAFSQLPQAADREDAVQETIRRAWEKRENLRDERYLQTWVVRILLTCAARCEDVENGRCRRSRCRSGPCRFGKLRCLMR